jgi:hypothetical protein
VSPIVRLRRNWGGLFAFAALPACLLVVACDNKSKASGDDAASAGDGAAEQGAATPEINVDPPAPVVAEDPSIPLNEAVVGAAPVDPEYHATAAPPELIVEDPPAKPNDTDVWIPGYWWWSGPLNRYVWITGAWRNPPPNVTWSPGSWVATVPGQWAWSPGFWAPRGFVREEAIIDLAPPPLRVEVMSARPDPAFFWTPGYYAYRERAYVWIGGSWMRPPVVGLGWIEPRYVGFGPHFFFQPGRWDFAPAARGTCYMPNVEVRVGGHFSPTPVSVAVVSAHAGYVSASANAIAHGATRTASGGYHASASSGSTHGSSKGGSPSHGGTPPSGNEAHTGGSTHNEPSGGSHNEPSGGSHNEPSGGSHNEPSGGSHNEPSGGTHNEPSHGGNEPTPSHGTEPTPTATTHLGGGGAPPSHGGPPPPSHGASPPAPTHGGKGGREPGK